MCLVGKQLVSPLSLSASVFQLTTALTVSHHCGGSKSGERFTRYSVHLLLVHKSRGKDSGKVCDYSLYRQHQEMEADEDEDDELNLFKLAQDLI